jgi:dephospho-CoA kinase
VGLTGAIGAGKSEAARMLGRMGVPVFSTDAAGHRILESDAFQRKLIQRYGAGPWFSNGMVDRTALAQKVFTRPAERRWLEKQIHPSIRREALQWKANLLKRRRSPRLAVVEVPLLHEKRWAGLFDGVLCVTAVAKVRNARLKKRGWTTMEIRKREKLQWSGERKALASDWTVSNEGSRRSLRKNLKVWRHSLRTWRTA